MSSATVETSTGDGFRDPASEYCIWEYDILMHEEYGYKETFKAKESTRFGAIHERWQMIKVKLLELIETGRFKKLETVFQILQVEHIQHAACLPPMDVAFNESLPETATYQQEIAYQIHYFWTKAAADSQLREALPCTYKNLESNLVELAAENVQRVLENEISIDKFRLSLEQFQKGERSSIRLPADGLEYSWHRKTAYLFKRLISLLKGAILYDPRTDYSCMHTTITDSLTDLYLRWHKKEFDALLQVTYRDRVNGSSGQKASDSSPCEYQEVVNLRRLALLWHGTLFGFWFNLKPIIPTWNARHSISWKAWFSSLPPEAPQKKRSEAYAGWEQTEFDSWDLLPNTVEIIPLGLLDLGLSRLDNYAHGRQTHVMATGESTSTATGNTSLDSTTTPVPEPFYESEPVPNSECNQTALPTRSPKLPQAQKDEAPVHHNHENPLGSVDRKTASPASESGRERKFELANGSRDGSDHRDSNPTDRSTKPLKLQAAAPGQAHSSCGQPEPSPERGSEARQVISGKYYSSEDTGFWREQPHLKEVPRLSNDRSTSFHANGRAQPDPPVQIPQPTNCHGSRNAAPTEARVGGPASLSPDRKCSPEKASGGRREHAHHEGQHYYDHDAESSKSTSATREKLGPKDGKGGSYQRSKHSVETSHRNYSNQHSTKDSDRSNGVGAAQSEGKLAFEESRSARERSANNIRTVRPIERPEYFELDRIFRDFIKKNIFYGKPGPILKQILAYPEVFVLMDSKKERDALFVSFAQANSIPFDPTDSVGHKEHESAAPATEFATKQTNRGQAHSDSESRYNDGKKGFQIEVRNILARMNRAYYDLCESQKLTPQTPHHNWRSRNTFWENAAAEFERQASGPIDYPTPSWIKQAVEDLLGAIIVSGPEADQQLDVPDVAWLREAARNREEDLTAETTGLLHRTTGYVVFDEAVKLMMDGKATRASRGPTNKTTESRTHWNPGAVPEPELSADLWQKHLNMNPKDVLLAYQEFLEHRKNQNGQASETEAAQSHQVNQQQQDYYANPVLSESQYTYGPTSRQQDTSRRYGPHPTPRVEAEPRMYNQKPGVQHDHTRYQQSNSTSRHYATTGVPIRLPEAHQTRGRR